ncbi:MAG: hypothetical protein ACI8W1_001732 [Candidatus Azotimanducaceae bacterium]|jgi:hypothetical protein
MLLLALLFILCMTDIETAFAAEVVSRDPTDPSGNGGSAISMLRVEKERTGLPKLSTIILGESSRLAVIDGKRIRENDRVGVYVVKRISRKEVVLQKSGEELRLLLPKHVEQDFEKHRINEDVTLVKNSNPKAS